MVDTPATPRPRPRPRPRPVAKKTSPAPDSKSSTPAASTSKARIEDEDDMFIKNKNRTINTWHALEKAKQDDNPGDDDSGSDSEENVSPGGSRKRGWKKSRSLPKPRWQRDPNVLQMLAESAIDLDSDSDLEIVGEGRSMPTGTKRRESKRAKRSRSRSLTPPPQLPLQQIQNVRNVVQRALEQHQTKPSYDDEPATISYNDNDGDNELQLDPELERIARQVRREFSSTPAPGSTSHHPPHRASSTIPEAGDEVEIQVTWHSHPLSPQTIPMVCDYKINNGDEFYELFEAVAKDAHIRTENLIVCYNGKRIFASVKPSTLNLWKHAEFSAFEKKAYEYIRSQPDLSYTTGLSTTQPPARQAPAHQTSTSTASTSDQPTIELSDSDDDIPVALRPGPSQYPQPTSTHTPQPVRETASQEEAEQSAAEDDNKFKLIVRSAVTGSKEITLTVRPSTKCGNIVKAFIKKAGLEAQYAYLWAENPAAAKAKPKPKGRAAKTAPAEKDPRLNVDGEKLENDCPIGDMDLEDGDQVEVVGL